MDTYLISFVLNNHERDYEQISSSIRSYPKWARVVYNTWLVRSENKATEIRSNLAASINNEGHILVMKVSKAGWATYAIGNDVTEWMKENV